MGFLSYIIWDPDPSIFSTSFLTIRWYGLLFALAFLFAQQVMFYIFRKEGKPEKDVEALTLYMMIATIVGARLGHVFFYEPDKYLSEPLKILKVWEGGLASHGATIGILLGLYLYSNYKINLSPTKFMWKKSPRPGQSFLWIVDRIVIVVALAGFCIRLGNFMNSEIEGLPTKSDYGVVFGRAAEEVSESISKAIAEAEVTANNDYQREVEAGLAPITLKLEFKNQNYQEADVRRILESDLKRALTGYEYVRRHIQEPISSPLDYDLRNSPNGWQAEVHTFGIVRHPAQLYESISSLLLFFFLFWLWYKRIGKVPEGFLFGLFLVILFGLRFFYEFLKENQVDFEDSLSLNMGQSLSIPLVLIGIYLLVRASQKAKHI